MLRGQNDETIEMECPECGAAVRASVHEAEKGTLRCPRGHVFPVMHMLGGDGLGGDGGKQRDPQ